jgi:hypothetical protein
MRSTTPLYQPSKCWTKDIVGRRKRKNGFWACLGIVIFLMVSGLRFLLFWDRKPLRQPLNQHSRNRAAICF